MPDLAIRFLDVDDLGTSARRIASATGKLEIPGMLENLLAEQDQQ